jgi:Putative zinc-finger/FecR protein
MSPGGRSDPPRKRSAECRQVARLLPALPDGDLPAAAAERVREHLALCPACREDASLFQKMGAALRQVPLPEPTLPEGHEIASRIREQEARRARRTLPRWAAFPALAALALVVTLGIRAGVRSSRFLPAWRVERIAGTPTFDAKPMPKIGQWRVGEWLETNGASKAKVEVANIGQVQVAPNTRVRLVETRPDRHQMELARGTVEARVSAPPRLFFVATPSATAVDLGCAYQLTVDDTGGGVLRVTSGWVALAGGGRESLVPSGARCETRSGVGPGTPCFEDASPALRSALTRLDFEGGGAAALATVLAEADLPDTLTLWHLLARVPDAQRGAVYDHLAALVPPPPNVTKAGALRLDPGMLSDWKSQIQDFW